MQEVFLSFVVHVKTVFGIKILFQPGIVAGELIGVLSYWQVSNGDAFDRLAIIVHQEVIVENEFCA